MHANRWQDAKAKFEEGKRKLQQEQKPKLALEGKILPQPETLLMAPRGSVSAELQMRVRSQSGMTRTVTIAPTASAMDLLTLLQSAAELPPDTNTTIGAAIGQRLCYRAGMHASGYFAGPD